MDNFSGNSLRCMNKKLFLNKFLFLTFGDYICFTMATRGTILKYSVDTKSVYLLVSNYVGVEMVTIDRKRFEHWLRADDRLSWSIDVIDEDGIDRPLVFGGNIAEYWSQSAYTIIADLEHYLYTLNSELN